MTKNVITTTKAQHRDLQKAALETLPVFDETDTLAVTLTMKQSVFIDFYFHRLDDIKAQKNLRHFINLLSREVFKNAHRRKHKTIQIIPSLQFSPEERLHYHALIRVPPGVDRDTFKQLIREFWLKTYFADYQIDIQDAYDVTRFASYMTRDARDPNIDWTNLHIADA